MKRFIRIFVIVFITLLSINANKSYGQTGVTISIDKSIICPGENIFLNAISTDRAYPYVLIYVSDDNISFRPLFTPDPSFPLRLYVYDPLDPNTIFNYGTSAFNSTTSLKRLYYKVAYWTSNPPSGDPFYSNTVFIDVRPSANVQNGFNNANQRVCINSAALPISPISPVGTSYSWFRRAPGETTYSPIAGYQNVSNPTLPSSAIPTNIVGRTYYRLVATYGSDCPSDQSVTYIDVDPESVAGTVSIASGTSTICYGTTAPNLLLTGPTVGGIDWQYSDVGPPINYINSGTSTPTVSNTTSRYYRARAKSGVCDYNYSNAVLVSISPATNTGTISPVSQTICKNSTPQAITLTNSVGSIVWRKSSSPTGPFTDIVGQTGTTLPIGSIDNTTTGYYQAVVTSGVCSSQTITSTVIVDELSVAGTVVLSGTSTICYNTTPPTLSLNGPTLGVINWQYADLTNPTNFISTGSSTPPIVSNTISRKYRVMVTNGQCSPAYSNEVTVTISQTSNAGIITPTSQTICQGGNVNPITLTGTIVGSIQWQKSNSPTGPFNDIVGQTGTTLPITSIDNSATAYYQAKVTNGACPPSFANSSVIVNLPSQAGTVVLTGTATICYQTTPPTLSLTGTNVGVVQWQYATLTNPSNFIDIGTTSPPTVSNIESRIYRVKVTSGVCSPAYSNEVLVTINLASNAGTISPVSQTICQGGTPRAISLSGSIVGTIQWSYSSSPSGPFSDIVGQTNSTLPIGNIDNTATGYYKASVTNGVCPPATITSTVIVSLPSQAGTVVLTGNATICYQTTPPSLSLTGTNVGVVQWQYATLSNPSNFIDIGTTSPPTVSNIESRKYRVKVTSGACTPAFSNEVEVTVDPLSNAGTISPTTQTICQNMTPTAIRLTGSIVGTIQWQGSLSPGGPYSDIAGQVSTTLPSASITNTTTSYYRALVTSGVCNAAVAYSTVNVVQMSSAGTATITAGNATICANGIAPTIGLTGSVVGNIQWVDSLVGAPPILNNTLGSASPIVSNTVSKYYKAIVTNTSYCPSVTSNAILVTINQASSAGTISPVSQSICINGTPNPIVLTNSLGTIQWQSSSSPSSGYTDIVGQTNVTLPAASISNTATTYYQAVVTNGVCPSATVTSTVIISNPSQAGTAILTGTASVCYATTNSLPSITLTGTVVGAIQWQSADLTSPTTFINISGTNSPTINNTASKLYRAMVKSGACTPDYSNQVLVEVNQASSTGTISPVTQTICINTTPAAITLTNPVGTIQWQSSTSPSTGYTNIIGQTATTLPSASISNTTTMYYLAVVTNGVCPSATISATVNVSPATVAGTANISAGTSTICFGTVPGSLPTITLTGFTGAIQWQSSTTNVDANFVDISGTNSPNIDNAISKYYRAKVKSGACSPLNSNVVYVSVDQPSSAGTISPPTQNICIGSSPTPISLTNYLGTIQWQSSTSTGAGTFTNMVGEITNALAANVIDNTTTKYYQAVVTNGVCPPQISLMSSVIISQLPVSGAINFSGPATICYGTVAPGLPTITLSGATGNVQWLSSVDNATYTNNAGISSPTVSPIIDNTTTKYYKASLTSGPCPSSETSPILVTVDPLSQVGSIIPSQKIQQVCIGSPASSLLNIVLPSHVGSIQWQTTAPSGTYTNMTGLNTATLPNTNLQTGTATTTYYRAMVKSGVCPSIYSDTASVQVDAATIAGSISSTSVLICNGSTPPTITLTGNLSTRIEWVSGAISGSLTSTSPAQSGQTISSVINTSAPGSTQVTNYYQALVTNGKCSTIPTNEIAITVDPRSQAGSIIPSQKVQQVCIGSPASSLQNIVLPSHVGTIQWESTWPSGSYANMTGLTTATLPNTNLQTGTATTSYYRAMVKSGVCPSIYSDTASVQVDAATIAGSISSTSVLICNGSTPPTITLTGNLGSTIVWQIRSVGGTYSNTNPLRNGTSISDVVNNSAPGSLQVVNYYQALVRNGVCNILPTNEVGVGVDPTSQAGSIIPSQKVQQVCIGSPASSLQNIVLPSHVGTIQWESTWPSGSYVNMTGLTTATLPNTNLQTGTATTSYYRAKVTSGVCPSIYSDIASVQVDAASVAGILEGVNSICNQGIKPTINVRNNTNVGNITKWLISAAPSSPTSVGSGAISLTYIDALQSGNLLNTSIDNTAPVLNSSFRYYRVVVKNGVCPADTSAPKELEVIPTPLITSTVPAERCGPGTVDLTAQTNLGVVEWYASNTSTTKLATGNNFTTPNLTSKLNYFYASGLFRGCASLTRTSVLAEVIPIPIVAPIPDSTYCGPHVFNICISATDNGIVNWYSTPTGGTPINIGNCYTTPLLRSNTTYYADAALRGCTTVTRTPVNALIYEVPVLPTIPNFNLCSGNTINLTSYPSGGIPPYTYSFVLDNGNIAGLSNGYLKGIRGGSTNVIFNIKDQNNCVSLNTNTFNVRTYDPVSPLKFNYQAYYKDDFVIPTKKDSGYILYNWNPGMYLNYTDRPEPIFNGEYTTDYVLVRTDTTSKCTVADNYHIDVTKDFILEVPNAFTPNNDGLNDVIRVIANAGIEYVDNFRIFNREGLQVFPLNPNIGWDSRNAPPKMLNGVLMVPPDYEHFTERVTPTNPSQPNGNRGWDTWDGRDIQGKVLDTDGYFWKAIIHFKDNTSKPKSGMFLLLK